MKSLRLSSKDAAHRIEQNFENSLGHCNWMCAGFDQSELPNEPALRISDLCASVFVFNLLSYSQSNASLNRSTNFDKLRRNACRSLAARATRSLFTLNQEALL